MRRAGLAAAVVVGLAVATGSLVRAAPAPDPKRKVAVLEFRAGSAELAGIDGRIAELLARKTSLVVVGVDEARKTYGDAFDHDLVACAGQAECLAALGRRLGVVDIVLVGVSEFGDVILTLQRIEVAGGRVAGRVAEALAPGSRPGPAALISYLEKVLPESDFRRFGILRIVADLAGAEVDVGGQRRGTTPLAPIKVAAPATYDIVVRKPGFVDFRASVAVPPEAEVQVKPLLSRRGERPAWYQHWWILAAAGTVTVGAIAAAVLVSRDSGQVPVGIKPF